MYFVCDKIKVEETMEKKKYLNQEILLFKVRVNFLKKDGNFSKVRFFYESSKKDKDNMNYLYELCENDFRKVDSNSEYVERYEVFFDNKGKLCCRKGYMGTNTIYEFVKPSIRKTIYEHKPSFYSHLCDKLLGYGKKPMVKIKNILKVKKILNEVLEQENKKIEKDSYLKEIRIYKDEKRRIDETKKEEKQQAKIKQKVEDFENKLS